MKSFRSDNFLISKFLLQKYCIYTAWSNYNFNVNSIIIRFTNIYIYMVIIVSSGIVFNYGDNAKTPVSFTVTIY